MVPEANSFNYYNNARKCIFIGRHIVYKNVKYSFIENSSKKKKKPNIQSFKYLIHKLRRKVEHRYFLILKLLAEMFIR